MRVAIEYRPIFGPMFVDPPRFQVIVAHRRAGKTVAALQKLISSALSCDRPNGRFAFVAPLHKQAKLIAWDYAKSMSRSVCGSKVNEAELRIDYPNGARLQLHGSDNPDALRGQYLDGCCLDEVAQMDPATWGEVIRPALSDRQGYAVFIGTPKGKNLFYQLYERSKSQENWGSLFLPASLTGLIPALELSAARRDMSPEEYEQEYELSWTAAIKGAFYAREMAAAEKAGRICKVPYDPAHQVITSWDLGVRDATAIWFIQQVGKAYHIIDYYEASGVGLDHYAKVLKEKEYVYAEHIGPHDIEVVELGSGRSRLDVAASLGLRFTVAPKQGVADGINAVRTVLPKMYFDREKCARGIEALTAYRQDWDGKLQALRANPLHDWTSHAADALRYFAVTPIDLEPWLSDWSQPLAYRSGAL